MLKIVFATIVFFIFCPLAKAQHAYILPENFNGKSLRFFAGRIEEVSAFRFYYDINNDDSVLVDFDTQGMLLSDVLQRLAATNKMYVATDTAQHVFISRFPIAASLPQNFFTENQPLHLPLPTEIPEAPAGKKKLRSFSENRIYEIGDRSEKKTGKVVVTGYVRDVKTGESIAGAVLSVDSLLVVVNADQYGYYSVVLPTGRHLLKISSAGMKEAKRQLTVHGSGRLDIDMQEAVTTLKTVTIISEKTSNTRSLQMGVNKLNIKALKQVPVAFGETDILKVVLTLPGVTSAGEAANGFNVRGGSADQNLILFNASTIYNPSHLFGLFSAFNPDVVKGIELYKNAMPEKYGGRLASVLDITMQDGNSKKWSGVAGIGPLTSKITIEGPIKKDKTSIIAGFRTTYSNWILKLIPNDQYKNSAAGFYDANIHVSHRINSKNNLYVTGYVSNDRFNLTNDTVYRYGNKNINVQWKHFFTGRFYNMLTAAFDDYRYNISSEKNPVNAFRLGFGIRQYSLRSDFSYAPNNRHVASFGISSIYYKLRPGYYEPAGSSSLVKKNVLQPEQALESAIYAGDNYTINSKLSVNAGLRFSVFNYLGPHEVYNYVPGLPRDTTTITDTSFYAGNKVIKTWSAPEIRVSMRYALSGNTSVKLSFNTLQQYIHMLSNTVTVAPTDTWKLSDASIRPQRGLQVSAGIYRNFKNNTIEASLEFYYKRIHHFLDYKGGAKLLMNEHIETDLVNTRGKAYGAELLVKKNTGRLNGWISYAYSRTFLQLDDPVAGETINKGQYYPASFDRPHNVNIIGNYKFSHRYSMSVNFVYTSGRPITLPIAVFTTGGINALVYSERNQYRIPFYMRGDISFTIEGNHKVKQKTHNSWSFGAYNITARQNAYSVYFIQEAGKIKGYQLSIFGTIIPFVTYNIKF